ncbi:sensor histidine kinase [Lutibacter holmesii]|uniref:histidine kinase n=1 Tax=Lutibacter holmesii TaxID=1137985 RepID=A0ABW3WSA9_9FLAO
MDVNITFCEVLGISQKVIIGEQLGSKACATMGLDQVAPCFYNFIKTPSKTTKSHVYLNNKTSLFFEITIKLVSSEHIVLFFKKIEGTAATKPLLQEEIIALEALNEDKNRFLAILAHDLKNALSTILGFSQLLKENYKAQQFEKIGQYISYIQNNAQSTYKLLEDTLVWTGSQSGKFKINKQSYVLNELLLEVLAEFKPIVTFKQIGIRFDQTAAVRATCDASIFKIILRNLISNAIKFSNKKGEIHIQFNILANQVHISVKDAGIGMSPQLANSLFKNGTLNSENGTAQEKGTGIGLAITKELIEKQDGNITVTSQLGKGSTFVCTLPQ